MELILINERDNVSVNPGNGHKYANCDIAKGEKVIKYGFPIGIAAEDIKQGEHVHSHNLKTALKGVNEYTYFSDFGEKKNIQPEEIKILAYERKNGDIGIRNDIWIIPTVGCVNKIAEQLARETGAIAFTHPYGCSQLSGDHKRTQQILAGLVKHPNAGGVLVLGLGCENNNIGEFKKVLGETDDERIFFLNAQECADEIAEGKKIIEKLKETAAKDERTEVPITKLVIGMKCGGSDGLSGITANPLCGKITDRLTGMGGSAVLTEVPEMFGAEKVLFNRCADKNTFDKAVKLINGYKEYFMVHGEPISENPSPGNKEGGITTLEEKSLGCVTKGGSAVITDVLSYGDKVKKQGLSLLDGPGNDMVAITNLTAAGCHMILFTTGRGTPLGAPVPTIKIATNTSLNNKKSRWIDFDAQENNEEALFAVIKEVAEGRKTKNELNGYREIAIMKDGVTL